MQLYKYQEKYLADLPKDCLMAAETGTGKSIMSLEHYRRHSDGLPLLILAPASKVRTGDWEREIDVCDIPQDNVTVISYEKATRKASFAKYAKGAKSTWWEQYMTDNPQFVLIADEVHKAKNSQSLTGKGVYMLARGSSQFIGLSATLLPNGWVDVCNYGKIFGWWKNKTEFMREYVVTYQIPNQHWFKISGYKHEDKLSDWWQKAAKPLKKSEALDLPSLTRQAVKFAKPKNYEAIKKTRVYRGEELDNAPKLVNALRKSLIDDKIGTLIDMLEGTTENVVVFYNYIEEREKMLEAIKKKLPQKKIYRQDGEKHEIPTKPEWAGIENSVTLGHYKSAATGVEMQYASIVIFLSPTYSYAEYSQAIGRVHRNGQTNKCTLYHFCAVKTIEQDIYAVLRTKKAFDVELWKRGLDESV